MIYVNLVVVIFLIRWLSLFLPNKFCVIFPVLLLDYICLFIQNFQWDSFPSRNAWYLLIAIVGRTEWKGWEQSE